MAVAAAQQIAPTKRSINGFKLTDIYFLKALLISTDAGDFETQTHLQPFRNNADKKSFGSEFRISTYESGEWSENCWGTIIVEFKEPDVEVDAGKEFREQARMNRELYEGGVAECKKAIESGRLYKELDAVGINYGPAFQLLLGAAYNDQESVADVRLLQSTIRSGEARQRYVIHPTVLDGILQLAFPTILNDADHRITTMVPSKIQSLWIANQELAPYGIEHARAYAKCRAQGTRTTEYNIMALDRSLSETQVLIEGLGMAAVEGHQTSKISKPADTKRLCYGFDWRPDVDLLNQEEILSYCNGANQDHVPPSDYIADVEFMCFSTISNVLEDLTSWNREVIKPHLEQYVHWMVRQKERYALGDFLHWQPSWPSLRLDQAYVKKVLARIENSNPEGKLYAATCRELPNLLRGNIDPVSFLFEGELAVEFYKHVGDKVQQSLQVYLDALSHKNPEVKILEIGAGTGGATWPTLKTLAYNDEEEFSAAKCRKYVFTDISPVFLEKAKERFTDFADLMVYSTLDIDKDPLGQGFVEGEFDLIVASNVRECPLSIRRNDLTFIFYQVLHATPDLQRTLQNTRKLLKT